MTDVIADDAINSPACFICGRESEEGEVTFCLFDERFQNGVRLRMISEVLSAILSFEITPKNTQHQILCNDCNTRLNKYEKFEQHMLDIKYKMLKDYSMKSCLNDGEIQFEVEEIFEEDINDESLEKQTNDDADISHDDHNMILATTSDETSHAGLSSLLSAHKEVADIPIKKVIVEKVEAGQIKLKNIDLATSDVQFLPCIGSVVEITADNDEFPIVVDDNSKVEAQATMKLNSKDLSTTFESYIFFNGLKYRCLVCTANNSNDVEAYEFDDSESIVSHLSAIHDLSIHMCLKCDQKFTNKDTFVKHERDVHGKEDVYYTHSGDEFSCLMCPPESKDASTKYTAETLSLHFKVVHTLRVYICDICGFHFRKRMELNVHVDEFHANTNDGEFRCKICNREFTNAHQFRIHKRLHYSSMKWYPCNQCNKRYSSQKLLDEHINMHTGTRPYKCSSCPKDFASKYTLGAHQKIHLKHPNTFTCKQCNKSFFSEKKLLKHEVIHSKPKEYICDVCNKVFSTQYNLEMHKGSHSRPKTFPCEVCGKIFTSVTGRYKHRYIHSDKKPYECPVCGRGFMRKAVLYAHMQKSAHVNDSIVINKTSFLAEDDEKLESEENLLIEMVLDEELAAE